MAALQQCAPVMGIWHAYANVCKKTYERFLQWMCPLENPNFLDHPEDAVVYKKPKLITVEHLLMGLLLAAPLVTDAVRQTLDEVQRKHGEDSPQALQCRGLLLLLTEYAPAAVEMGIQVRQCYWKTQQVGSGSGAREVLRDAAIILRCLHSPGNTEYIRNLMLSELLWCPLHDALPAAAFVEECMESSLSVLTRHMNTDTRGTTVQAFSDTYTRGNLLNRVLYVTPTIFYHDCSPTRRLSLHLSWTSSPPLLPSGRHHRSPRTSSSPD